MSVLALAMLLTTAQTAEAQPAPAAETAPVQELAPAPTEPKPVSLTEEPKKRSPLRAVSYALLGAGVATAGAGLYFGASASSAAAAIMLDRMSGFSEQDLQMRDQSRAVQSQLAIGLLVGAAIIAAIAIVLFTLSS
jgi:hypothetical protein